ncbi:FRG1-like family-domain-containing protein [Papiliotrema laurentii]|uniref:FRG1-like family-domain-containing protein n=1 Tax=Papiliotrema laurentii TaxID=5418 RepID=A0AAD9FNM4_PAPLA|nr:FRG1-like family-domain-containing protein [Papiliotrema laurentii]
MSGVISKKLKFKGDKPKKKKRAHREVDDDQDEFAAMAAADPKGWIFPDDPLDISGPSYIILPTSPLTCLAWDNTRQRVVAAPIDVPEAPEGAEELSPSEVLAALEPTDVNTVWVVSRLSGSEDIISLRTASGTFLTAHPSGTLTASTPSRGPLEAFKPSFNASASSTFPSFALQTQSENFISVQEAPIAPGGSKNKFELRADAKEVGEHERIRVKCQREFVLKARLEREGRAGVAIKRRLEGGPSVGSVEDEIKRNREAQTWGAGRVVVSESDRKDLKKARKEGRLAEAMLDRRAALKSDRYAK